MKTLVRLVVCALAFAPATALANDFISTDPNDWFRYTNARTGQQVTSSMQRDLGGWRNWSDWAGMGSTWIYTDDAHDTFWIWNGTTYTQVANLSGQIGDTRSADMPPCNTGTVQVLSRGPLTTAAGTFNNVTRLGLQISCADAGTTSIWFAEGVGVVKWTESSFMGEVTWELDSAMVSGALFPQSPAAPAPSSARPVAPREDADMETILWGANDTYLILPTYRDSFTALDGSGVTSTVIVSSQTVASELRYELAQDNVPMGDVEIYVAAIDSVWMRDYGPIILTRPDGSRVVADPEYYYGRPQDNAFPSAYARFRGWDYIKSNVSFEGGNFACDGNGVQFSSYGVQWFNRDLSVAEIERDFLASYGSRDVVWLEPLKDEGTTHIDMFVRIMDENNALVSRYPSWHKQAQVVDDCARTMRQAGYTVTRVDVDYNYDEYGTYSNSVLANGIALIPMYTDAAKNQAALNAYAALGFNAHGVDGTRIIKYSGATHCVSMQVPSGR
jgi:agmatine/peptidylarginine deiminase